MMPEITELNIYLVIKKENGELMLTYAYYTPGSS